MDDLIGRLLDRHALERNEIADLPRHSKANEVLPAPRSRNSTRLIRSVCTRANDRRITHAPRHLALQPTRRRSGGDVALAVLCNDACCTVTVRVTRFIIESNRHSRSRRWRACGTRRNWLALFLQLLHERLPTSLREEETGVDLLQAVTRAKGIGSRTDHHHVGRLLHDGACERDGMSRVSDASHR